MQHRVVLLPTAIYLTFHLTSSVNGHVTTSKTVVAQASLSNKAFPFFWALHFH